MPLAIPNSTRLFSGFSVLTVLVLLAACSSHDRLTSPANPNAAPAPQAAGSEASKAGSRPTPSPSPAPASTPVPAPTPLLTPPPTPPPPTSAESKHAKSLSELLQNGRLLRTEGSSLLFSKVPPPKEKPSGLFEDAIILGRLRSRLNQVPELPSEISDSATVKDSTADLTLTADLPNRTAAAIIDAALDSEGVALVRVRF